jgi:predicted nucleic acid-binding protein
VRAVVLDTNVVSEWIRDGIGPMAREAGRFQRTLTFVTLGELAAWSLVRSLGPRRRAALQAHVAQAMILRYDRRVADTWGELNAGARMRGRPASENDTWIAACCIVTGLPLLTYDTKDFRYFADHHGLGLVG